METVKQAYKNHAKKKGNDCQSFPYTIMSRFLLKLENLQHFGHLSLPFSQNLYVVVPFLKTETDI